MKNYIKTLVSSLAMTLAVGAFAETEKVGAYTYTYRLIDNGKSAEIYNNADTAISPNPKGALAIPAKLGGKPVTSIGDYAFVECQDVTAVTIPTTVTNIGEGAFAECYMGSIVLPDNVKTIGEWAFANDTLQCVQFGKKIESIGERAFANCKNLNALVFKGTSEPVYVSDDAFVKVPGRVYVPANAKGWPKGEIGIEPVWKGLKLYYGDYLVNIEATAHPVFGGAGEVTGGGSYALGKKISLKAKAQAGSVFGGWYMEDVLAGKQTFLGSSPSYSDYVVTGENVKFAGRFVSVEKDVETFQLTGDDGLRTNEDGSFECKFLGNYLLTYSEPKLTLKGLPAGLKYDAKTVSVSGKATKPGIYKVTASATNVSVKKAITADFTIEVPNFKDSLIPVDNAYGDFVPGVNYVKTIDAAEGCTVTGLPAGFKWTAKDIVDNKTKTVIVPANSFYGVATKPGNYTAYFTKTVDRVKHTATATFVVGPFLTLDIVTDGEGTGKVTGAGAYPANKKVSLKATPDKGSVFMGWYDGADLLSQAATFQYEMPAVDNVLTAVFITSKQDADGISVTVMGRDVPDFNDNLETEVKIPCGVNVLWPIQFDALSQIAVKVSGLPAGLKFTTKDIVDSQTGDFIAYANSIYGAPTAESKTKIEDGIPKAIPTEAKIEVTTAGKTKKTYVVKVYVEAMQPWAVGTFSGGDEALGSITVSSSGKINGKLTNGSFTETISAAQFNYYYPDEQLYETVAGVKSGTFFGGTVLTLQRTSGNLAVIQLHAYSDAKFYTVPWKAEPWKTLAKGFDKPAAKTLEIADVADNDGNLGVLTLRFASSGAVSATGVFMVPDKTGKLVKYSGSCSSTVTPITDIAKPTDEFDAYLHVVFPYKDAKFPGYNENLELHWNGTAFSLK